MRNYFRLCIYLLLCVLLIGCSNQEKHHIETTSLTAYSTDQALKSEKETTSQSTKKAKETNSSAKETSAGVETKNNKKTNLTNTVEKSSTPASTTKEATITKATTTKSTVVQGTAKSTTKAVTTTAAKPKTTKSTTTESKNISCTVSIECSAILSNMGSPKAGHEDFIPSDGIILSGYSITVENGESVYDALSKACSSNGIRLSFRSDIYGKYISGINNIDEKDCGPRSGWTYTVNGSYPPKSCDKYKLEQNDRIVFIYTCS